MRMSALLISAATLAIAQLSAAQERTELDLATVIKEAQRLHPSLRAAQAKVSESRGVLAAAKAESAPKVDGALSVSRLQDSPTLSAGSLGRIPLGGKDQRSASIGIRHPLYSGGKLEAVRNQALELAGAQSTWESRLRQQVAFNATVAFYGVLKMRATAETAEDQLKAIQSQRHSISRMVEEGAATRVELMRAQTAVAAAQEALQTTLNGEALARARLANAMGLAVLPPTTVVVDRGVPASLRLAALSAVEQTDDALARRADFQQTEAEVRAAEAGVQVAQSGDKPNVSLFASFDARRPSYQPDTGHWSVGFGINVPIFDGGMTRANVSQARSRLAQAKARRDELRNTISLEVTQAALNVRSARERLATTREGLTYANEGMRLIQIGYENGVHTITDFLATQAEQTRARNDEISALYDLRIAEATLRFAMGNEPGT